MIPKIIHYCWFGNAPIPSKTQKIIDGWKKLNPDYNIIKWDEKNFDYSSNQYAREAYERKKWAFVTDYARLKILSQYGGIYMDSDVEVIKPLDILLSNKAFSGFEADDRIPTGIMGAEPHNPWIDLLLEYYTDKSFITNDNKNDLTTNIKIITDLTLSHYPLKLNNQYQNLGDVTFYPFDYLCAKDLKDGKIKRTCNTITIHHFNGSWTTPKKKIIKFINEHLGNEYTVLIVKIKKGILGLFR